MGGPPSVEGSSVGPGDLELASGYIIGGVVVAALLSV